MMASNAPVLIIGAGLAGLTLARTLLKKNIPTIVFEQSVKGRSPGYGLVLQAKSYNPLLSLLQLEEEAFRKAVAVDSTIGRSGEVADAAYDSSSSDVKPLLRANKRRLRDLLAEKVDIRWEHKLKSVKPESQIITAVFENGESVKGSMLIAADGVHSIARKQILPNVKPDILKFAVINGQRRVAKDLFDQIFLPAFSKTCSVSQKHGDTTLIIAINDTSEDLISLSYTYSRPARSSDPIFKPDRALEEAKTIPEEFFEELASLEGLDGPFKEIFDPKKAREDKLLSWLMRSVRVSEQDMASLPARFGLLGDAAHAMPIVAGKGGNHAILDGLELGEALGADLDNGYRQYSGKAARRWQEGIDQSERNLSNLHGHEARL